MPRPLTRARSLCVTVTRLVHNVKRHYVPCQLAGRAMTSGSCGLTNERDFPVPSKPHAKGLSILRCLIVVLVETQSASRLEPLSTRKTL